MTDFRSVETLGVFKNDQHVANLRRLPKGCEFSYTTDFLASHQNEIALHLPKSPVPLTVEGLANLPTYFAGLLPEGIMFNAVKALIGSAADDLFAVLAATGNDAIGDIDVRIPGEDKRSPTINFDDASNYIQAILDRKSKGLDNHIAAIPGVQPKLSLGEIVRVSRKTKVIAKFDSPEFPGLVQNEFACMRLARRCGLEVPDVKLHANALLVQRFDRIFNEATDQLEKVHVEDMLQVMDFFPNSKYSMEYDDLLGAMLELEVSKATLLDALRLFVFSYLIGNGDLHAKNVSLVKYGQQWKLSPVYDLLSTLPFKDVLPGAERMALSLADESFGRYTTSEFVEFGHRFGLPERAVTQMVSGLVQKVLKHAQKVLRQCVSEEVIATIIERARSLEATQS